MRGLSSAEAFVLADCAGGNPHPYNHSIELLRACVTLQQAGRIRRVLPPECGCGCCGMPEITPAGVEALKLHRQLAALGAL